MSGTKISGAPDAGSFGGGNWRIPIAVIGNDGPFSTSADVLEAGNHAALSLVGNGGTLTGPSGDIALDSSLSLVNDVLSAPNRLLFGSGVDGNAIINSGTTNLARDMCYNNLTMSGTGQINTNGFRIFVAGTLDLTAAPIAAINFNGGAGVNGAITAGIAGASNGGSAFSNMLVSGNNGQLGSTGGTGVGSNGSASAFPSLINGCAYGGDGGQSGAGGTSSIHAGGTAGAAQASSALFRPGWSFPEPTAEPVATNFLVNGGPGFSQPLLLLGGVGGGRGGTGGGDGTFAGGLAAGGGAGGGVIQLYAAIVNRSGATAASVIQATGGKGGNSSAGAGGNTGGGGGAAGGGGGVVYMVAGQLIGSPATNAIDVSGGAGGNGGAATGTGVAGGGGNGSNSGYWQLLVLSPASLTHGSFNVASVTPPSGATGGAGGISKGSI